MVQPTPFQRLLQDVSKEARADAVSAFAKLDDLFGKTTTEADLLQYGAFATNLGVAALGRHEETERLLRRCLDHPALTADAPARRSLHRALAVTLICGDKRAEAEQAMRAGVSTPAEECRFAGAAAQTLLARNRLADAVPYLRRATVLCAQVSPEDDVLLQTAGIAANLLRVAEPQCLLAHDLLTAAADAAVAASARAEDWRARHKALFHQGKAWLLAGVPARALAAVQTMMKLEKAHEAGPMERFYSANLACRAQAVRGQFKVAAGAYGACSRFADEAEQAGEPLGVALEDLEKFVTEMKAASEAK
jgi:hypothetical protein